jgi:hypothetical protein
MITCPLWGSIRNPAQREGTISGRGYFKAWDIIFHWWQRQRDDSKDLIYQYGDSMLPCHLWTPLTIFLLLESKLFPSVITSDFYWCEPLVGLSSLEITLKREAQIVLSGSAHPTLCPSHCITSPDRTFTIIRQSKGRNGSIRNLGRKITWKFGCT